MMRHTIWQVMVYILLVTSVCTVQPAATRVERRVSSVYIGGAAILRNCRFMRLTAPGIERTAFKNDTNFPQISDWLLENVWRNITDISQIETKPEYYIYVYADSDEKEAAKRPNSLLAEDVMLGIPLTPDTLGPDYRSKISKLEKIMEVKHN